MTEINIKVVVWVLVILLIIDAIYITIFSNYFIKLFESVQKTPFKFRYESGIMTYFLMTFTVYYFGFVKNFSNLDMFILGACVYGTYDLTNYSTFKNWSLSMVILDIIWGGVLYFLTAYIIKKLIL
tara:strand:+ start:26820 stop:27197 length:378 start_codon:yes stop_codon:yes gene_type:complete